MIFHDRTHAGKLLSEKISISAKDEAVVYGLARGGLAVAYEVAKKIKAPLEALLVRKIGHPDYSEYAIGAVAEDDEPLYNLDEIKNIDRIWLKEALANERKIIAARSLTYRQKRPPISAKDKVAIIIDDGMATGLTMQAAVQFIKKQHPAKIIVAIPVSARSATTIIKPEVDKLISLTDTTGLDDAVGAYYENFPQVTDEQAIAILNHQQAR